MNHRAVIETILPTGVRDIHVIAAGPPDHCQRMLREYLKTATLTHLQTPMILEVVSRG